MQRRLFLTATLGGAAVVPALAMQQAQVPPYQPRDWSGDSPLPYPDPDIIALDQRFRRFVLFNTPIQRHYVGTFWAEGPAWNGVGRYLVWSDIPNNRQMRWIEDDGRVTEFRNPSGYSNGNTFGHFRNPRISRCTKYFLYMSTLVQFPNQRVFSSSTSDDQDLHLQFIYSVFGHIPRPKGVLLDKFAKCFEAGFDVPANEFSLSGSPEFLQDQS